MTPDTVKQLPADQRHRPSAAKGSLHDPHSEEGSNWEVRLGGPRQEFEDLLPTGLAFALKSHDPLMQPDDGVSF